MKALCRIALAVLFLAACGGESAVTGLDDPMVPNAPSSGGGILAIGVDSVTGASIETNQDEYVPGEVVHLVGRGWSPGETVNLRMTEEPNTHADVDTNVVADAAGGFSIHFYDVQPHDLGVTFTLTATGLVSNSVAVAVFTDDINLQILGSSDGTTQHATLAAEENLGTVTLGSPLSLTCPRGTGLVVKGPGGPYPSGGQSWTLGYGGTGVDNATLSSLSTLTPASGTFSGASASSCVGLSITTGTLSGGTTYHGSLLISGPGATTNSGLYFFRFTVAAVVVNGAPVINAAGPYNVAEGTPITLSGATATDPENDALTYKWTVSTTGIDGTGSCTFSPNNTVLNPSVTCNDDSQDATGGKFVLTLEVKDASHTVTDDADLLVTNANPTANAGGPYSGAEGSAIQLSGSGNDPGDNDDAVLTYAWSVTTTGIDASGTCTLSSSTAQNPTVTCTDDSGDAVGGVFKVNLVVSDDDGGVSTTAIANLTVTNANPVANAGGPYSGSEGGSVAISGSKSDAGGNDTHTIAWTYALGAGVDIGTTCSFTNAAALSTSVTCTDDGTFTLTLTITDDDGGVGTSNATLTVGNVAPAITTINAPIAPVAAGTNNVTVSWDFTDPGSDVWTCSIQWDAGQAFESGTYVNPKSCSATKTLTPGLYTVTVKVADDDGGEDSETVSAYIVVYDPNGGFVTGGGWINSLAGYYRLNTAAEGKANFGFVSKYQPGRTVPTGNTEFQFHAGNLNFKSTTYEWLVVAGSKAIYKGEGTITGMTGVYGFLLSAIDGSPDRFRIKIWEKTSGDLVYDTLPDGAADDADPATTLGGGSIVVHNKK